MATELATRSAVERVCAEARRGKLRSIALPSGAILLAQHFLEEGPIKISCRIGFPDGGMDSDAKRYETELAIDAGAHEIELVPSLARIEEGDLRTVLREIRDVAEAADERPVKVALDPARWPADLLREMVPMVLDSGAHYLCTSGRAGRLTSEIAELRNLCGPDFGILARVSGLSEARDALGAGANIAAFED